MTGEARTITLVYWGARGGGSQVTLGLACRLAAKLGQGNVRLSLRAGNAELAQFLEAGFTPDLIVIPPLRRLVWTWPATLLRVLGQARRILRGRPDAIVFTMNFPFAWPLVHLLRAGGASVTYLAHDADPHPGDYARTWQASTQALLLRFSDRILTLSDHTRAIIAARYPHRAKDIRQIPLQALVPIGAHAPHREPSTEGVRLLFLGRLIGYKGLNLLAEALAPLRDRPGWRLTIAGDGPLAADVRAWFREWRQVSLELGWIADARFAALLRSHDALVCPYIEASQSGVVAEALATGLPCLVLPNGELPRQITRIGEDGRMAWAGVIAAEPTAEALRTVILDVIDSPAMIGPMAEVACLIARDADEFDIPAQLLDVVER